MRITPARIWMAWRTSPQAARLLLATRDLASARNELRWLREHANQRPGRADSWVHGSEGAAAAATKGSSQRPRGTVVTRPFYQEKSGLTSCLCRASSHPGKNAIQQQTFRRSRRGKPGRSCSANAESVERRLRRLVYWRSRGYPLQYLLGTQPFDGLDILCRPGVLIPRWETEAYTVYLAEKLTKALTSIVPPSGHHHHHHAYTPRESAVPAPRTSSGPPSSSGSPSKSIVTEHSSSKLHLTNLRIIDFCTGTGAIPLGLAARLAPLFQRAAEGRPGGTLTVQGIDISRRAVRLAKANHRKAQREGLLPKQEQATAEHADVVQIEFLEQDLFTYSPPGAASSLTGQSFDSLPSNPPLLPQEKQVHSPRISRSRVPTRETDSLPTLARSNTSPIHSTSRALSRSQTHPESASYSNLQTLSPMHSDILVITANPPYISQDAWMASSPQPIQASVRRFEPKLALVPRVSPAEYEVGTPLLADLLATHPEDIFYHRLIGVANEARANALLMEVGDEEQAVRVVRLFRRLQRQSAEGSQLRRYTCEGWRDQPDGHTSVEAGGDNNLARPVIDGSSMVVRGHGALRSIILHDGLLS